ncbi:hypothetical protein K9L67_04190 [Candidatus Woesearchaeota archaeon]|nr:hypothetical protein [Candidatus Woesearchaeota archaeon]MCF7901400.1 hypothetical protein [Candidatus Woesearchaeota archaeon]MCF8013726.1 hypothetical protein [Candidatus Woesearchaeota archaeon]
MKETIKNTIDQILNYASKLNYTVEFDNEKKYIKLADKNGNIIFTNSKNNSKNKENITIIPDDEQGHIRAIYATNKENLEILMNHYSEDKHPEVKYFKYSNINGMKIQYQSPDKI